MPKAINNVVARTSTKFLIAQIMALFEKIPSVDDLTRWAQGIKSASVTLIAAGAASISGVGVFHAVTSDSVVFEPLKVPPPFEERGFTSEITTARLLDEIISIERKQSSSAKDRVSIMSKDQANNLEKLQSISVGGIDTKTIQGSIQDALGIQQQRITGEITYKKTGDEVTYHVRLRKLPGNQVLLDLVTNGEPQIVLQKTALAMIEVVDPHIAASIYWRNKDEENALRMIDVVLNNETKNDDKYSLNLRGYINITNKRYDAAKADFDAIMVLDPKFAPAHGMASWIHLEKNEFEQSLAEAEKAIEYAPLKWWGYYAKARTLREMKKTDEAILFFNKTIELKPDAVNPYIQAGAFLVQQGKTQEAINIFSKGLLSFPDNSALRSKLGDVLVKVGDLDRAEKEYRKALEFDDKNLYAVIDIIEIISQKGDEKATDDMKVKLSTLTKNNVSIAPALMERVKMIRGEN